MAKIVYTRTFLSDLEEIIEYYLNNYSASTANVIKDKILNAVSLLEQFPQSGRVIDDNGESIVYRIIKDRYNIYYTYDMDVVRLICIADAKTNRQIH